MRQLRVFAEVLRVPGAAPLVAASLVGRLVYGMGPVAVLLLVHHRTGSYLVAGIATGAAGITGGLLAPVRGRAIDRHGPRRMLPLFATGSALCFLGVVGVREPLAAVLLSGAAGALLPPFGAAMRVAWRGLVDDDGKLQAAYALDAATEETLLAVGPAIAGFLAAWQPSAAVAGVAVTALLGAVGFLAGPTTAMPRREPPSSGEPPRRQAALRAPGIRTLVVSLAAFGAGLGMLGTALVAAVQGQVGNAGILLTVMTAGSAIGALWYGGRRWSWPTGHRYLLALGLLALACAPMAMAPSLVVLGVLSALAGFALGPVWAAAYVLAADLAPEGSLTEAATWVTTAVSIAAALGRALAGQLVDGAGVEWALTAVAASIGLGALLALAGRATLVPVRRRLVETEGGAEHGAQRQAPHRIPRQGSPAEGE